MSFLSELGCLPVMQAGSCLSREAEERPATSTQIYRQLNSKQIMAVFRYWTNHAQMYDIPYLTNFASWKAATSYYYRHEGAALAEPELAGMLFLQSHQTLGKIIQTPGTRTGLTWKWRELFYQPLGLWSSLQSDLLTLLCFSLLPCPSVNNALCIYIWRPQRPFLLLHVTQQNGMYQEWILILKRFFHCRCTAM